MGSLGGHLLPGTFFILFGMWWSIVIALRMLYTSHRHGQLKANLYRSSSTMPCVILPCLSIRKAPVESYLKIVLATAALLIETHASFNFDDIQVPVNATVTSNSSTNAAAIHHEHLHHHDHSNNLIMNENVAHKIVKTYSISHGNSQHITMYSAFIVAALIDLLVHYGSELPDDVELAATAFAFFVEGLLFSSYLHGKEVSEVYAHVLLVWAIAFCFIFSCLEYYNKHNILFTYGRCLFTIFQGTWFYRIGFMPYSPTDWFWKWDPSDRSAIMNIAVAFCWHILLIMLALLLELYIVRKLVLKNGWFNDAIKELMNFDQEKEFYYDSNVNKNKIGTNNEAGFLFLDISKS